MKTTDEENLPDRLYMRWLWRHYVYSSELRHVGGI